MEREKGMAVDTACRATGMMTQLIEDSIPAAYKYILHAAETNRGFYSSSARKASNYEEDKSKEQKVFLINGDKKSAKIVIKFKEEGNSEEKEAKELVETLKLNREDVLRLQGTQEQVKKISENTKDYIAEMCMAKNGLLKEISILDKLMREELYSRLDSDTTAAFSEWIERVKFKALLFIEKELT